MSPAPKLTLHGVPNSHPVEAVVVALRAKGLDYERVDFAVGEQVEEAQKIYGEGRTTVPGVVVDGAPVHGSHAIFEKLDEIETGTPLYPEPIAAAVREADLWADDAFQRTARVLAWGALHFRPEQMGTFVGGDPLDPAGTDYAITMLRRIWKYLGIDAKEIADRLAALPGHLDHVAELARDGVVGGDTPNAADLQIGSSVRLLLTIGDVRPLLDGHVVEEITRRHFPDEQRGDVPAGAVPIGWVPATTAD